MREKLWIAVLSIVSLVVIGVSVATSLLAVGLVLALIVLALVWALRPKLVAPLIAIAGMFFVRPNIWGEQYSNVGLGLFLLAAFVAFAQDAGRLAAFGREFRPVRSPLFWVTLAYLWLLFRGSFQGLETTNQSFSGYLSVAACVLAIILIAGDKDRRSYLIKGFVVTVIAVSASFAVTVAVWLVAGIGSGAIGSMMIGNWLVAQPVYFPFTTTVSTQPVLGMVVPRLVGFAREPGWMAMYACVAYFVMPLIGWRSKIVRLGILAALLGTISTAGFGVLIMCMAIKITFGSRPAKSTIGGFARFVFGLALIALAIWSAFYAPILGFDAKGEQNGISLSERSIATNRGIWALQNEPWSGGIASAKVGAVNLVAAVAAYGLPFSVLMGLATIGPLFRHPNRRALMPVIAAIFATLLLSQPALDSTWAFALSALVAAAALVPATPPPRKARPEPRQPQPGAHYQRLAARINNQPTSQKPELSKSKSL